MDITKIFKSKTRSALFRLYFTNPEKNHYLRELERMLNIPVSMLRKELLSLKNSNIFNSNKKGNLSYYSINKEYPLYNELKNIVFKTIGIQGSLSTLLSPIKGIKTAFIYGSYAKSEDNAASDIDLFIIGKIAEVNLISKINTLEKKLKREINYSYYSIADFEQKKKNKDSFIMDVLKNKKIFLIGGNNDL
ncbi:MAG: nucleotidyltransferase domain-containing protein [Candidatus Omnitrophica bacterium]|nr:nucleotidyltransferase domain-containing protein [Candidatus Omnitrophota bacterium]